MHSIAIITPCSKLTLTPDTYKAAPAFIAIIEDAAWFLSKKPCLIIERLSDAEETIRSSSECFLNPKSSGLITYS